MNVHPAKLDVRFLHEREVERAIREAVSEAMAGRLSVSALARYGGNPLPGMQGRLRLLEGGGSGRTPSRSKSRHLSPPLVCRVCESWAS